MKRLKKRFSKILVLLIACLSVGTIVSAAESTSTEVQIAIEASELAPAGGEDNNKNIGGTNSVQTGDKTNVLGYLLVTGAAVGLGIICLFKKKRKGLMAVFALFLSLFLMNNSVYAAEGTENVNVTIPSSIAVSFEETGENSISDFSISNQSLVPVSIDEVKVTECNEWKLCDVGEEIPVNTKKMAFVFDGQCLKAEDNALDIAIAENSSKDCNIHIKRGAWTTSGTAETALQLEFEYTIGKKEFQLTFDTNGATQTVASQMVYNGDTVSLPSVERDGYAFAGWEDSDGNLHTDKFVMPIGGATLTARWKEEVAYAIYIASDTSLRFVRSADPITAGSTYNGMTVTEVFTGFENTTYSARAQVPWYDGIYYNQRIIKKVIVEDKMQPANTAYWFDYMDDCEYLDVTKLDTSRVTNMRYMFSWTGFNASTFTLKGVEGFDVSNVTDMTYTFAFTARDAASVVVDLSKWNVSNVKNMEQMFTGMGYFSSTFGLGDLSKWNVSNVTNMYKMFQQTGYNANWYVNCSRWNVSKVTNHMNFNYDVSSKVIAPPW